MQRYFLTDYQPDSQKITLPKSIEHHLMTVLRADVGTKIEVVLSNHHVYLAHVVEQKPALIAIDSDLHKNSELPVNITIACGIPKTSNKLDLITQKATELGASQIVFFDAQRSISRWNAKKRDKKIAHLQKIANSASEQSHRNFEPVVSYGGSLKQLIANFNADHMVVAWEESAKRGETSRLVKVIKGCTVGSSLLAIFGPEGGITEKEISVMKDLGVVPVGLGPRILRTETAPLYFLSAVSAMTELKFD